MKKIVCFIIAVLLTVSTVGCNSSSGGESHPGNTGSGGASESHASDAHAHSYTLVKAVKPTCTSGGNSAYYKCDCGKIFLKKGIDYVETDLNSVTIKADRKSVV